VRRLVLTCVAVVAVSAAAIVTKPPALQPLTATPELVDDLDGWLARKESGQGVVAGAEKRIRWIEEGRRTPIAIVYLHGFSASRQEIAPTFDQVADALGANLFETRLTGHGLVENGLVNVSAEAWLEDAAEALAIGARLGDRLIVAGTSTGATLAIAMAEHELMERVSDIVMVSPNLALRDARAELLTLPFGPQIADVLVGETRSFPTENERHARFWTSTYPTRAAVEMMRLVDLARRQRALEARVLMVYSPDDKIVSPDQALATLRALEGVGLTESVVSSSDDPNSHVLAGDVLSPNSTAAVGDAIIAFLEATAGAD